MTNWHQLEADEVLRRVDSRAGGLTANEVAERFGRFGPNELIERDRRGPWKILWEQLREPMVLLLVVAAGVSIFVHEYLDAGSIGVIVVLNAILGFVQDFRAERAMQSLKRLAMPEVKVRRGGAVQVVPAIDLMPGDVVLLEAGNRVPADGRVLEAHHLKVQEAALTGESEAVSKHPQPLAADDPPLGERTCMVYMGTDVSAGRGEAVVTATGMRTELGKIADMLQSVPAHRTPLQRRLAKMGIYLAGAALAIVALVFALGIFRGQDPKLMLLTALSMAVAAVPEGLPAVATIALALGAKRMLRRRALIRKLPAVETLGSVTVICSDKTGTLTENRMQLSAIRHADQELNIQEHLGDGDGDRVIDSGDGRLKILDDQPQLALLLTAGALCSDAKLKSDDRQTETTTLQAEGDPTEGAFVIAAARFGLLKPELDRALPRVGEVPFDSERKRMTTVHELPAERSTLPQAVSPALRLAAGETEGQSKVAMGQRIAMLKGAADAVLAICSRVLTADGPRPLDDAERREIAQANDEMASAGKRVLGLAFRWIDPSVNVDSPAAVERDFIFLGLAGLIDPPRSEVRRAVARCQSAGIRPVMITGDHPLTAMRIAGDVGIAGNQRAIVGADLEKLSDEELRNKVEHTSVYARVTPEHKLRIVKALQHHGHIVAMTGDGVNDAPALKQADIGVAMGITGTDVSKDAAETVLLDDNFATIVNSVEEGRTIYDNIRKFLQYTMTSNTGEIWVMLLAPLAGMPLPLAPLQILWINLVTDGLPGLAMAVEPSERDTMRRPPRDPQEPIFDRGMVRQILVIGLLMGLVSLGAGYWFWSAERSTEYDKSWGTIVFTVLTLSQMGNALAIRSTRDSLFSIGLLTNMALLGSVALTFALQLVVIYVPFFQEIFRTAALGWQELLLCLLLSSVVFWAIELEKLLKRRARAAGDREASAS